MSILGQRFRSERESKGARRVDVAQATKVAVHHLAALEYGDFKALPDAVHTKGYVRAYAEYLGIDPTAALAEFLEEYEAVCPRATDDPLDETVRKMSKMLTSQERSWARRLRPMLVALAIVAVVVLGWFGLRRLDFGGSTAPVDVKPSVETATPVADVPAQLPDPGADAAPAPAEPVAALPVETQTPPREPEAQPTVEQPPPPVVAPIRTTTAVTPARLSVSEYGVGTGVENLRLQGESDRFPVGTRVWFWTRVLDGRSGETIQHVWRHEGREIASIALTLGSANWRTYSRKTMYDGSVGSWTVEVVDEAGNVLAASAFDCDP